jgi:hypothetical protein
MAIAQCNRLVRIIHDRHAPVRIFMRHLYVPPPRARTRRRPPGRPAPRAGPPRGCCRQRGCRCRCPGTGGRPRPRPVTGSRGRGRPGWRGPGTAAPGSRPARARPPPGQQRSCLCRRASNRRPAPGARDAGVQARDPPGLGIGPAVGSGHRVRHRLASFVPLSRTALGSPLPSPCPPSMLNPRSTRTDESGGNPPSYIRGPAPSESRPLVPNVESGWGSNGEDGYGR